MGCDPADFWAWSCRRDGGVGAGPVEFTEVVAELAAACGSTAMIYLMHVSAAVAVSAAPPAGMPDCWRPWPPEGRSGRWRSARRGLASHFWAPVSAASVEGDDVAIKADKSFATSAGFADVYVASTGVTRRSRRRCVRGPRGHAGP